MEIEGDLEFSDRSLTNNTRFLDGTNWSVRQVWRCDLSSEGNRKNCLPVPDHWQLAHSGEVIVSEALTDWFKRVEEYMPVVEPLEFPESATRGEPLTISGARGAS